MTIYFKKDSDKKSDFNNNANNYSIPAGLVSLRESILSFFGVKINLSACIISGWSPGVIYPNSARLFVLP